MPAPAEVVAILQGLPGLAGVTQVQADGVWPWVQAVIGSHHVDAPTMRALAIAHALDRLAAGAGGLGATVPGSVASVTTKSLSESYHAAQAITGGALTAELSTSAWGRMLIPMLDAAQSSAPFAV